MKAMVLAAGLGLRMRPLSRLRAKPALPVLNRPLVHWTLEALARHGVDEVVINLHHLPETVVAAVGDGRAFGLEVRFSRERRILGTGGGPRKVRRLLGTEPVLLVNGDVLFDFDLSRLVRRHRAAGALATLALRPNPDPRRYGPVVCGRDGWIRSVPGLRRARGRLYSFTGVHVIDPRILDRLPAGRSDSVRDLYARLLAEGEAVQGVPARGAWYDLGSPALYLASHEALLRSRFDGVGSPLVHPVARVDATARVVGSVVGAGCVVEAGARVRGSVLWEDVVVSRGARLDRAVLTSGVRLPEGARVADAVVLPGGAGGRRPRVVPMEDLRE